MEYAERRDPDARRYEDEEADEAPVLEVDEARAGDSNRENFRALDLGLLLAIAAFLLLAIIFASAGVGR